MGRVELGLSSLCVCSVTGTASQYLADNLRMYVPSQQLRSSSDTCLFQIPSVSAIPPGQLTVHTKAEPSGTNSRSTSGTLLL